MFLLRLISPVLWPTFTAIVLVVVYFCLLLRQKKENFKKLRGELGYPVPKINSLTFGHLNEFTSRENESNWHKQLGKLFGFYNCDDANLKVSDLNIINEIFLKQNKLFNARTVNEFRLRPVLSSILFNRGEKWKKSRRILQPALSKYRLKGDNNSDTIHDIQCGLNDLIEHFKKLVNYPDSDSGSDWEEAEVESRGIKSETNDSLDKDSAKLYAKKGFMAIESEESPTGWAIDMNAYSVMQAVTLDVIFRIGFNKDSIDVTKGSAEPTLKLVRALLKVPESFHLKLAIAVPLTRLFVVPYMMFIDPLRQAYLKFINELVDSHIDAYTRDMNKPKDQPSGPERIYHVLMTEYHAGGLKRSEVLSNTMAILVAGFETTATTSSYLLWCIAKHTECKKRLQLDIQNYGVESKYLDMFIKEVMRMYPALPNFVVRTPHEDTKVAGHIIKRGMSVYLSVFEVHYDPKVWKNPTRFDPERFSEGKSYPKGAYAPFGLGHRMCAGYQLAMREMKTIVSELLTNFDIQLIAPQELSIESATIFLTRPRDEIRIRLVPIVKKPRGFSCARPNVLSPEINKSASFNGIDSTGLNIEDSSDETGRA